MILRTHAARMITAIDACCALALIAMASTAHAQAQTGTPIMARFFDGVGATPYAVAVQPDGRVIAVGAAPRSGGTDADFAVMRFLSDGTPDPAFGSAGRVTTDFAGFNDIALAVAVQPNGAIVVAGTTATPLGAGVPGASAAPRAIAALARYTATGALDSSFGAGGKAVDQHPTMTFNFLPHTVTAVAVAPGGEILVSVGMYLTMVALYDYQLQRYGPDGVQLPAWGQLDASLSAADPFAFASGGQVVTFGRNFNGHGTGTLFMKGRLTRYTSGGSLDTSFNGTGILDDARLLGGQAVAVQSDDKIVVSRGASVRRITASGAPDVGYGQEGTVAGGTADQYISYGALDVGAVDTIAAAGQIREFDLDDMWNFAVLVTTVSGQIIMRANVDFGGNDSALAVRFVGGDIVAAGLSRKVDRTDVAWTRLVLNPWQPLMGRAVVSDWDGDGKSDMIVTSSTGEWRIATSRTGFATHERHLWGAPTDIPIVADFDGNRQMDLSTYRQVDQSDSVWRVLDPTLNQVAYQWTWGTVSLGDLPVAGDYAGDTRTDVAVFRPLSGEWLIRDPITGSVAGYQWGQPGDVPVPQDYDGDGRTDLAIYRPSTGQWWVYNLTTGGVSLYQWGIPGDIPMPGDYLGTGQMQIAIYRPLSGTWWIYDPASGQYFGTQWGATGDVPLAGDYVGDRRTDLTVWRPSNGAWFVWDLGTGSYTAVALGAPDQRPALRGR